jgi:hypothetical protein
LQIPLPATSYNPRCRNYFQHIFRSDVSYEELLSIEIVRKLLCMPHSQVVTAQFNLFSYVSMKKFPLGLERF